MRHLLLSALLATSLAATAQPRSYAAKAEFAREHPCPSTGAKRPSCPGYVIDHIVPLCAGGPDAAANMQWQSREESYAKDKLERAQCRRRSR